MIVKTKTSQAIMEYLNQNKIVNLNIIGIIENEPQAEIYVDDEQLSRGILVRHEYFNYIYTEDDEFLDEVLETLFRDNFYGFSGLNRPLADKIRKRYLVAWESRCALHYLPKENLDLSLIKNPVSSIDIKDAAVVDSFYTYRNPDSLKTIEKDISHRPSSAIYVNGDIASWVLIHNDNSMGIMFTKEEYRKNNYAVETTIDLALKITKLGNIPFLQINEANNMSPGLAARCGFVKYGYSDWFGIIEGTPKELIEENNKSRSNHIKTIEGFRYTDDKELNCMYLPSYIFNNEYEKIEGFTIEKVTDSEMIDTWSGIFIDVLEIDENKKITFKDIVYNAVSNIENDYTLYNGILNGEIVSTTAFSKLDNDCIGLYFWAVKPSMRSQGIGRATVIEALKSATKNDNMEFILLQSPYKYVDMFKTIGFVHTHYLNEHNTEDS
ncbi:GNAT family N-acetyltransferase [Clostridium sp. CF012]|uniref:GNAT family N-acetyltransferase n=1 Tax=Clostridium sp. CF012 TaxID=2843319 RepID=UPI001C0AF4A3|nr:GNAT family N-acetyltransferase [Clostridium sp. CF012]MBU3143733.1 GNAT family N-acetyltransferase [Clostridium sp. CF012]